MVASFTSHHALGEPQTPSGQRKPRVAITGGLGKLGQPTVHELYANGWEVVVVDRVSPRLPVQGVRYVLVETTDFGQVAEALREVDSQYKGLDAVVHLAALPVIGQTASSHQFRNNALSTYHVLEACRQIGIKQLVLASSETLLGLPLDPHPPDSLPFTESSPRRPESAYTLSKLVGEVIAEQYVRWDPQLSVTSLRFSLICTPEEYADFPTWQHDPKTYPEGNCWSHVDARDGAQAIRLALATNLPGHNVFLITSSETCMRTPSAELVRAVYPDVPYEPIPGRGENQTLLSIEKARKVLGYEPKWGWRDEVARLQKEGIIE
ncbi:NAD(P)-binding protein [Calocera viscosa TUFC12733]|uniref:NAD(P)-binding protein n=1 Tax=Calocera viscosa (strain TUFC12733) TaxID=1330018 RepID=A0A167JES2_CALVF|nr:NAD(P)-binding protein [Calocera viscosa TUFC12733]